MNNNNSNNNNNPLRNSQKKKDYVFYCLYLLLPTFSTIYTYTKTTEKSSI